MRRLLLASALVATLAAAAPAAAAGPVRLTFTVDRTQVSTGLSAACGFPVQVHQEGKRSGLFFFDAAGNLTREILHDASFTNTWTNLDTGTVVKSPHPIVAHTGYAADGSSVVRVTGLEFQVSPASMTTGRRVWLFDADGEFLDEIFSAGQDDGLLPGLCEALA